MTIISRDSRVFQVSDIGAFGVLITIDALNT